MRLNQTTWKPQTAFFRNMPTTQHEHLSEGWHLGSRFVPGMPMNAPRGVLGSRLGRRPGESLEFVDFRDYQPGDDLRKLDWNAYARSDSLVVRVFREEVAPHLDLILDASASMAVRDGKAQGTFLAVGLLAGAAANGGFSTRAFEIRDACHEIEGSASPPQAWQLQPFDGTHNSGNIFIQSPPRMQPRGIRVFISDLLFAADPEMVTAVLADQASAASVIQLLDEPDRTPPENGTVRLVDSETGQVHEIFVDATVRLRYSARLENHTRQWEAACARRGLRFASLTAEALESGNLDVLLEQGVLQLP